MGFTNPSYLNPGQSYSNTVDVPMLVGARTWYVYVSATARAVITDRSCPKLTPVTRCF